MTHPTLAMLSCKFYRNMHNLYTNSDCKGLIVKKETKYTLNPKLNILFKQTEQ